MIKLLSIDAITRDEAIQPRATLDPAIVAEYAQAMEDGAAFPPITVFDDGQTKWLADGFHRRAAAKDNGRPEISANVRTGTRRDAILFAVGANTDHGLRRTNEDKRRAVETLLKDKEWSDWSDREIARRCAVDNKTVAALRPSLCKTQSEGDAETPLSGNGFQIEAASDNATSDEALSEDFPQIERTVKRGDSTYTMRTASIGKRPPEPEQPSPTPTPTISYPARVSAEVADVLFGPSQDVQPVTVDPEEPGPSPVVSIGKARDDAQKSDMRKWVKGVPKENLEKWVDFVNEGQVPLLIIEALAGASGFLLDAKKELTKITPEQVQKNREAEKVGYWLEMLANAAGQVNGLLHQFDDYGDSTSQVTPIRKAR